MQIVPSAATAMSFERPPFGIEGLPGLNVLSTAPIAGDPHDVGGGVDEHQRPAPIDDEGGGFGEPGDDESRTPSAEKLGLRL